MMSIRRVIQKSKFDKAGVQNLDQVSTDDKTGHVNTHGRCSRDQSLECKQSQKRLSTHDVYGKLKLWDAYPQWEDAESAWDKQAREAAQSHPLKQLPSLPQMPGMTAETAKHLKWKSLRYIIQHDRRGVLPKYFFKHPLQYSLAFLKSVFRKKSFERDDDFFFYGCRSVEEFEQLLAQPNSLLVLGFSYCHKPHECPSKRFTPDCIHDKENPVCQQCFIGKAVHAAPEKQTIPLFIPTIHYIGEKIFEIVDQYPDKEVLFIITACEMTLEMFGDWGNMVNIKGIGVRLDGRICNTMKAFELSEEGIKPGLTVVLPHTQKRILDLIRSRRLHETTSAGA